MATAPKGTAWSLMAVALLVSACSAGASHSSAPADTSSTGAERSDRELPIDAVLALSLDDRAHIHQAVGSLITDCMAEAGFSYIHPPFDERNPYSLTPWIGLTDETSADQGYQSLVPAAIQVTEDDLGAPSDPTSRRAFLAALKGTDIPDVQPSGDGAPVPLRQGGCEAAAYGVLYDDYDGWVAANFLLQQIRNDAIISAEADSTYLGAVRDWARCMRDSGYAFATPSDAVAAHLGAAGRSGSSAAAPDEIEAAKTDVACKGSTEFVQRVMSALSAQQVSAYDAHQAEIDAYGDRQRNAVSRADEILAPN